MGWFSAPLGDGLRSSAYAAPQGYPEEHHPTPAQTDLGDGYVPGFHGVNNGPTAHQGNTGDLYQDTHPGYAGLYVPDFRDASGAQPVAAERVPAVGSQSLVEARDARGVPGTNRAIHSTGPVTGTSDNLWSGRRAATVPKPVGQSGPVSGGQDANSAAARAYYSQQASYVSQAMAEATLMAAV